MRLPAGVNPMHGARPSTRRLWASLGLLGLVCLTGADVDRGAPATLADAYRARVRPILTRYCLDCHSAKAPKGDLDLARFDSIEAARGDVKPWQALIEMLETGSMPPKKKPQPTDAERAALIGWSRDFLAAEARARAGDPGRAALRRLSNAEYDATVRDLTGVDLHPTREFPADGAAGEGFTNAAEALSMSPTLLAKYLKAAKEIASHAVLLPDTMRFSPANTRRDWTDESVAAIRAFYARYTGDEGRLPVAPYLAALTRQREALSAGKTTIDAVAAAERLSPKYLAALWNVLSGKDDRIPFGRLRALWRQAAPNDARAVEAEIAAWQEALWRFQPIGSYRYGNTVRQYPNEPTLVESLTVRAGLKPAPGQSEAVLYLVAQDLSHTEGQGAVVLRRPRFEQKDQPPLLLRDYASFGPGFEVDYATLFADTPRYLAAAIEAANDRATSVEERARRHDLDAALLQRWVEILAVEPFVKNNDDAVGKPVPAVPLTLLDEPAPSKPAINGWKAKGADLPVVIANRSDKEELVPGRVPPHGVAAHPTPGEFVAVVWQSPLKGKVRVDMRVQHAHPACGNGVAWWLERRAGDQAAVVAEGTVDLGKEARVSPRTLTVAPGELVLLAIDARESNHSCDLTEIALTLTESGESRRRWDLAADVADHIADGNPHADSLGNAGVWRFVKGPSRAVSGSSSPAVPADSVLDRWRTAAADPQQQADATRLADAAKALLTGARPTNEKHPDRKLYDQLASFDGPLLRGLDLTRLKKTVAPPGQFGLDAARFGRPIDDETIDGPDLILPCNEAVALRLPAALLRDHEFVADGVLNRSSQTRVVQLRVLTSAPSPEPRWDGNTPLLASLEGPARPQLRAGLTEFRRLFPTFVCFPHVIPTDEVVCLLSVHREDEPLVRLFLDDEQTRRLNRLWDEHRFISKYPVVENEYLPLFIGFVTQDQPKELLTYFESQRGPFRERAEQFEREFEAAAPRQLDALLEFTARAYRRPLEAEERRNLLALFEALRASGASHEDAYRGVLERVLVSPSFLYHIEQPAPGKQPGAVNDWELASRLSYFLWSSLPDEPLRQAAAAGRLHEPAELAAQTRRMLKDERVRALAIEFGTQWIHVRGFDALNEKNERLFPTFDPALRTVIYEESIRFFQDLFQNDRTVAQVLDADYTFLNDALARHYGIPGVDGPQWRRVDGVKRYGRGGILGLASVLTTQAGASRTSPVLRGNWVVETLLGEKLPRPPANVPRLPDEEGQTDGLTTRQLVEKHVNTPECAVCHQRIDPFGFALEKYDPIGRLREKELGGLPVDAKTTLRDGTAFDGIDGIRAYLLTTKKDVFTRIFCRRLLGYALGREVALADQPLIDTMVVEAGRPEGRVSSLVLSIVGSPQFRLIRGAAFSGDE